MIDAAVDEAKAQGVLECIALHWRCVVASAEQYGVGVFFIRNGAVVAIGDVIETNKTYEQIGDKAMMPVQLKEGGSIIRELSGLPYMLIVNMPDGVFYAKYEADESVTPRMLSSFRQLKNHRLH